MPTKRERELLDEITELRTKLEHAQIWMQREVQESKHSNLRFWKRWKHEQTIYDRILDFAERVRHIRLIKRRYTRGELWMKRFEAFMVGAAIILFWRGIWALADQYLFADNPLISALASLAIGGGILILSKNFVNQFIDDAVEEADEYE